MKVKYRIRDKDKKDFVWFEGEFIKWGVDYEEFESGAGNFTCGIIKKPDGQITMIYAEHIKFINPPKSEQGDSKNNAQQTQPAKCYILLNKGLPINVFSSLEKVEAAAKSNTNYHWASFDVQ